MFLMSDTKLHRLSLDLCIPRATEYRSKQINTFPQVRSLRTETVRAIAVSSDWPRV